MADVIKKIEPTDLTTSKEKLKQIDDVCALEDDIHLEDPTIRKKHTSFLGEQYQFFRSLDAKYSLSKVLDFATVAREILIASGNDKRVEIVLGTIRDSRGTPEAETGLNVQELLVRTWFLAQTPLSPSNARELVVLNLVHNKDTGGGCLAGISARLVQPFSHFVDWILNRMRERDLALELMRERELAAERLREIREAAELEAIRKREEAARREEMAKLEAAKKKSIGQPELTPVEILEQMAIMESISKARVVVKAPVSTVHHVLPKVERKELTPAEIEAQFAALEIRERRVVSPPVVPSYVAAVSRASVSSGRYEQTVEEIEAQFAAMERGEKSSKKATQYPY